MLRDRHHGQKCPYCARPMSSRDARLHPTRDHVTPVSKGGTRKLICCFTCNAVKADMLPEAWEAFRIAHPSWWLLTKLELRRIRRQALGLPSRRRRPYPKSPIVVPPELIFGASQLPTERKDP